MQDTEELRDTIGECATRSLWLDDEDFWYIQDLIAEARREWEEEH